MPEQPGHSLEAVEARRSTLASQHGAVSEADLVLTDVLNTAHSAARESVRRLDAIAEQIDHAVVQQANLAVDTPMGRESFTSSCWTSSAKSPRSSPERELAQAKGLCWRTFGRSTPPAAVNRN